MINALLEITADITRYRPGAPIKTYSTANDPLARGELFREANDDADHGDVLILGPCAFDLGKDKNIILKSAVTYRGMGREDTILNSSIVSDTSGTAFTLTNTILEDMALRVYPHNETEDSRLIGFDSKATTPFVAIVRRCNLLCNDWTVYAWTNVGHALSLEDCQLRFGRIGIANMGSGAGNSTSILADRCFFDGDASRSKSIGATSNSVYGGVFGAVVRGGTTVFTDCRFNIIGKISEKPSYTPRVCAITDQFNSPASTSRKVGIHYSQIKVIPNGADPNQCFDLDLRYGSAIVSYCYGSGPNGEVTKSNLPPMPPSKEN